MSSRASWMCRSGSLCWSHRSFPALFLLVKHCMIVWSSFIEFLWVDESIIFGVLLHFWLLRYFHDIWWEWYAVHFLVICDDSSVGNGLLETCNVWKCCFGSCWWVTDVVQHMVFSCTVFFFESSAVYFLAVRMFWQNWFWYGVFLWALL